jgi:hypothetical protein
MPPPVHPDLGEFQLDPDDDEYGDVDGLREVPEEIVEAARAADNHLLTDFDARAECIRTHVKGVLVWLAPNFVADFYENFESSLHYDKCVQALERVNGPVKRVEVFPTLLLVIFKDFTGRTSLVIPIDDTKGATIWERLQKDGDE